MPTVTLNKKVFEDLVGKKLPMDKLKDRISMLGTDLERIEANEIVVEVFPNRPDMLSEQGFARAFSSFIGVKTGLQKYPIKDSGEKVIVDASLKEIRPYTVCAIVKGLKLDDEKIREIIQIQEKLHVTHLRSRKKGAIGIYPIEHIKFPIRFTALEPEKIRFRPLESPKIMTGKEILEKHPTGKEYGHLLSGFKKYPVFIDANDSILSMPPIINSHNTGKISESTKEVFIECSGFDPFTLKKCLNIIVAALSDMKFSLYSMKIEYPDATFTTPDLSPSKMPIELGYINKRLGLALTETEMQHYLERMGFGYEKGSVLVPAYRADILHMVDFVEDIAIAYGYENFQEEIPDCATIGHEDDYEVFKGKVAEILVGLGLVELNTNNITNKEAQTTKMNVEMPLIRLKNALSADYNTLRAWVTPSVIEILSVNKHNEYPQNVFNIGRVFKKDPSTETGVMESDRLCVALCSENAGYTDARQVFDYLMSTLGITAEIKEADHLSFIPGRVARANVNGKDAAYIGELHPQVLENWQLSFPIAILELNLTEIYSKK